MKSGLSRTGMLWALLSLISSLLLVSGFYFPYWITATHSQSPTTHITTYFGLFRRCNYPHPSAYTPYTFTSSPSVTGSILIEGCARYATFSDIPSPWWRVGVVVLGGACALSFIISVSALICCCTVDTVTQNLAMVAGGLQVLCFFCVVAACVTYPLGWNSEDVRQVCGQHSDKFRLGDCSISWAFYTTIAAGVGLLLSSLLTCKATKPKGGYQNVRSNQRRISAQL